MKLKAALFFLSLVGNAAISAAQTCCCVSAGANYSVLPNLNKNLVGIRYNYTALNMVTHSLNEERDGLKSYEHIHQIELFGRYNLNQRLLLSVFIPVNIIDQRSETSNQQTTGLGDMTLLLQYALINPMKCTGGESKHQLHLGFGSKLPSGNFRQNENNMYNTSVQAGSGSIDFLASAIYTYRYRNFGFNFRAAYKLNTVNPHAFRFGNKTDAALNLFYLFKWQEISFMPSVGATYSHLFPNFNHRLRVYRSDSDLLTATIGMDVYLPRVAFNLTLSPVAYNRVPAMSFKQQVSAEVGVFYHFQKTK